MLCPTIGAPAALLTTVSPSPVAITPVGLITVKNPFPRPGVQLLGPIWPLIYLNPLYAWLAHRMGGIVAPLDPTPASRLRYYMALQVDAVLADEPGLVLGRMLEILRG